MKVDVTKMRRAVFARVHVRRRRALDELIRVSHEGGLYEDCDTCQKTGGH